MLNDRRLPVPRRKPDEVITDVLNGMSERALIAESDGMVMATDLGQPILSFYANSIAHHFNAGAAENTEIAAVAE